MQLDIRSKSSSSLPTWLDQFIGVYLSLSADNLELLANIYHPSIEFIDPMHQVSGLDELSTYFQNLYENLLQCDFQINHVIENGDQAAIYWTMSYRHKKLNQGKVVTVSGNSHIKEQQGKVIYHRDYLDAGAMLYEQIPVLGTIIRWLKAKVAS